MKIRTLFIIILVFIVLFTIGYMLKSIITQSEIENSSRLSIKSDSEKQVKKDKMDDLEFNLTQNINFRKYNNEIYIVKDNVMKLNFEEKKLEETNLPTGYIYTDNDNYIYNENFILKVKNSNGESVIAENVKESYHYYDYILYKDNESIYIYNINTKESNKLISINEKNSLINLKDIFIIDKGLHYAIVDHKTKETTIFKSSDSSAKHVIKAEAYSGILNKDLLLLKTEDNKDKLQVYDFKSDSIIDYSLVLSENEHVFSEPKVVDDGRLVYFTNKDGILNLNYLNINDNKRNSIVLKEESKFIKYFKIDDYDIVQFDEGFYYEKKGSGYNYYNVKFEKISIDNDKFFLTDANTLSIIKDDQLKKYSLKGDVIECIANDDKFYYTYSTQDTQKIEMLKVELD